MPQFREIIEITIRNHPAKCIFRENTVDYCTKHMERFYHLEKNIYKNLDELARVLGECEIYCLHEGVDRRENRL